MEETKKFYEHLYKMKAWRESMRERGLAAVQPELSAVREQDKTVLLLYPDILDEPEPGSLVAIGDYNDYKLVRLKQVNPLHKGWVPNNPGEGRWVYEEIEN